jgi:hypothetical protein
MLASLLSVVGVSEVAVATDQGTYRWITYFLIALSVVLLTRSFWVLYVQKRGSGAVKVITWLSLGFVVCFWSYQLFFKR